jgi:hypothetical protein
MTMGALIYLLCALTAFTCFALLWRAWRGNRATLLLWSALCFAGLTLSNVLLVVDKLLLPAMDLTPVRLTITLAALLLLIIGLVGGDEK